MISMVGFLFLMVAGMLLLLLYLGGLKFCFGGLYLPGLAFMWSFSIAKDAGYLA